MKVFKILLLGLALTVACGFFFRSAFADACSDISDPAKKVECLQNETEKLASQAKTLSGQIAQFDAQIKLTGLKISQTEEKILLLGGRIDQLESSLTSLTRAFSGRAVETYKLARVGSGFLFLVTAGDLTQAVSRFHYLQKIQEADRVLLEKLQTAQTLYKGEKTDQESLQKQLEEQKKQLANQKAAKAQLLAVTRNDEKRYQQLLSEAIAQLNISKGLGTESFVRDVAEGDVLGSILPTASGCSSGRHLHFQVHKDNSLQDPNNYLRNISFSYSPGYDLSYFGSISPHGNWNWPMNEPIQINQGYGATGYARYFGYANNLHPGIDLESPNSQVKAVKNGKLYRGSIQCGGRYPGVLPYAKVESSEGFVIYYEHMYVQ